MDTNNFLKKICYAKYENFDESFFDFLANNLDKFDHVIDSIEYYMNDDNLYGDKPKVTHKEILLLLLAYAIRYKNDKIISLLNEKIKKYK